MIDIEDHHFFLGGTSSDSTRPPGDDGSSIFKPWKYDRNIGRAWTVKPRTYQPKGENPFLTVSWGKAQETCAGPLGQQVRTLDFLAPRRWGGRHSGGMMRTQVLGAITCTILYVWSAFVGFFGGLSCVMCETLQLEEL